MFSGARKMLVHLWATCTRWAPTSYKWVITPSSCIYQPPANAAGLCWAWDCKQHGQKHHQKQQQQQHLHCQQHGEKHHQKQQQQQQQPTAGSQQLTANSQQEQQHRRGPRGNRARDLLDVGWSWWSWWSWCLCLWWWWGVGGGGGGWF